MGRGGGSSCRLTCQSSIDLKHALHVRFGALKCIQVAHKDARVNRLRILRVRLVGQFWQLHCAACRQRWRRHRCGYGCGCGCGAKCGCCWQRRSRSACVAKVQESNSGDWRQPWATCCYFCSPSACLLCFLHLPTLLLLWLLLWGLRPATLLQLIAFGFGATPAAPRVCPADFSVFNESKSAQSSAWLSA